MPFQNHQFVSRLKNASFQEIFYRLNRLFLTNFMKLMFASGRTFVNAPSIVLSEIQKINLPKIVQSEFPNTIEIDEETQFQMDTFVRNSRMIFFSNIKTGNHPIDIRLVWESGRLQNITKAVFSTENISDPIQQNAKKEVLGWIQNNPFLHGVHYISPMECGLRIPVFFYILKSSKLNWNQDEIQIMLSSIYWHSWWVSKNLAFYSSLGNHTISESIGLIFGGAIFQKTREGKKWIKEGCRLLDQEIYHQIHNDGGPAEQSFSYHRFVLDLYWLAASFLESNNLENCSVWKERLSNGEKFLSTFSYNGRQTPFIGDSDDGYAVAPGFHPVRQSHDSVGISTPISGLSYATFPDSGYTVIKNQNGLLLTFDHGPLGMAPLFNHGHADALSITVYKSSKPFFIDPGTYRYNGVPEYRTYFKSTRAHNTICIDNTDQARPLTGFIWDKPYQANLECISDKGSYLYLKARHDGYSRLRQPIVHDRELFVSKNNFLLIIDTFIGNGFHEFELNFHLNPDVAIGFQNEWITQTNGNENVFLHNTDNSFTQIFGQLDPMLGWFSPQYGILEKTTTLQSKKKGRADQNRFINLICFDDTKCKQAIDFREEIISQK